MNIETVLMSPVQKWKTFVELKLEIQNKKNSVPRSVQCDNK